NYYDSDFRPFCSERCKQIDLGHWLEESYNIPSGEPLQEEDFDKIEQEELKKDS
ncbi:MAG: DNA gyrase inhibitor YacG, partial [Bdellovibrionota bacterium]|nr:DNA gyrase inhibitor YacG [Bdellovibrionota bacterium]